MAPTQQSPTSRGVPIIAAQRPTKQVSPPRSVSSTSDNSLLSPPSKPSSSSPSSSSSTEIHRQKPNFEDEQERLRSFGSWPQTAPISKDKVARAGFYYLGTALEVACPVCKVEIGDWSSNDVAVRKHKDRSPNCSFVLSLPITSKDIPFDEMMKNPQSRFNTFYNWPKPEIMDPQRLVNAGFYFLHNGDKVRCAWCKGVIEHWNSTDIPFEEHAKNFACCPFVVNPPDYACRPGEDECGPSNMCRSSSSGSKKPQLLHGVIPHSGPKHPHQVSVSSRESSFQSSSWPSTAKVPPSELAEAGFFFLGMHDYTKCFHCDGGLCNWEEGDKPWVEHARWFPNCEFVKLNKGDNFIAQCQELHQQLLHEAGEEATAASSQPQQSDTNLPDHLRGELETIMNSKSAAYFIERGVPQQVVRMTLKKFMIDHQRGFHSHDEMSMILAQVLSLGSKTTSVGGQSERSKEPENIPENVLCRVCMAEERGVVFLPCGHLATCPSCAASVTECVVCRTPITGTLRTFLS